MSGIIADNQGRSSGLVKAAAGGGVHLKKEIIYNSDTSASFSSQASTNISSLDFYYPLSIRIGGAYTKLSGTSTLHVEGQFVFGHSTTNIHSSYIWEGGDTSANASWHSSDDNRITGQGHAGGNFIWSIHYNGILTGLSSGSKNIYFAVGTGNSRVHTHELNPNTMADNAIYDNGDMPAINCRSFMLVSEYED